MLIIGGGASGLGACKEFAECPGFTPILFEASSKLGGVFRDAYDKLQLTSSTALTAYSDFPAKDSPPKMWTGPEYLEYLQDYVDAHRLSSFIRYGTKVEMIRREGAAGDAEGTQWCLTLRCIESGTVWEERGAVLIVCTGSNSTPSRPPFPGEDAFGGSVMHTSDLGDSFQSLAGKRVLSVGLGESGSDIPLHIARLPGTQVTIVYRGLGWCVPRTEPIGTGLPADLSTNRVLWGIPRIFSSALSALSAFFDQRDVHPVIRRKGQLNAEHPGGVYGTYGTKSLGFLLAAEELGVPIRKTEIREFGPGKRVLFQDGTSGEYDAVLLNTGYTKTCFDLYADGSDDVGLKKILADSSSVRNLHKRCVHPAGVAHNLFFVGFARPAFGAIPPIAELQARWLAATLSGKCAPFPSEAQMLQAIADDTAQQQAQFHGAALRVSTLVDYTIYVNDLADQLGASPPWVKLLLTDWLLLQRVLLGPHVVAQFRLAGPGAKPELARTTILSFPSVNRRRIVRISVGLYAVALFLAGLSLLVPLPSDARARLLPVGFPRLRSWLPLRRTLACAHVLGWAAGAAVLLASRLRSLKAGLTLPGLAACFLVALPVAATLGLEARSYVASRRRVAALRETIVSRRVADAEWSITCGKRQVKEAKQK